MKRADGFTETDADTAEKALVWGDKYAKMIGATVGSRGTSRVCEACFESSYNYLHERDTETRVPVFERDGEAVQLELAPGVRATGFLPAKNGADTLSAKEAIAAIYAASRPPADASRAQTALGDLNAPELQQFLEQRGNSAVYVCPFCNHVADADVQASLFVAMKRLYKEPKGGKQSSKAASPRDVTPKESRNDFQKFTEFCKERLTAFLEYDPMQLVPSK